MTDQPDRSDRAMLALVPPMGVATHLSVENGTPPDDVHLTVAYLGLADDVDHDTLLRAAKTLCKRPSVVGRLSGHAVFTGGERDVLVALVDSADLEALRRDALDALRDADLPFSTTHGYTPHMTIRYLDDDEELPFDRLSSEPVEFQLLTVVHGQERTDFPFVAQETTIAPYARTAYAQGWAASGGPMTDRVKAGCVATVDLCCENAHDPGILEVALHLGHLEGVWAKVFHRRFKLIDTFTEEIGQLWRKAMAVLDVPGLVVKFRQAMGLGESTDPAWVRRAKAVAREEALLMLSWVPGGATYQELRDTMRRLIASGRAEGHADAIAVAAADAGKIGINFDLAFQAAYDALENLGQTWADSDVWLGRMLGRAADEFGRTLGDLAASGASYEQMVAAGLDVLQNTTTDESAVRFITDWAASTGMSRGALDLYQSENVSYVSWLTAGDGRVCPECEDYGQASPFLISEFPDMPAHPRCRCVAAAEVSLGTAYDAYLE